MDSRLADFVSLTPAGQQAAEILRRCVHCGFCTATCPTYQLLGDELDGPRGRIYLIKQLLEGQAVTERTRLHLDRCLTCRACETTCPSGVEYGHLLDIGRRVLEERLPRRGRAALQRRLLREVLTRPVLLSGMLRLGRMLRPLLPSALADKLARPVGGEKREVVPGGKHARRMLLLAGCVQPALAPNINAATVRVFDRLGIELFVDSKVTCCGGVRFHLDDQAGARAEMRRNIDAWWPHVAGGVEAIVVTASGCGVQIRDYGHLLAEDAAYADKAARISALCRDPSEILCAEREALLARLPAPGRPGSRLAWHAPCTLQHGLGLGEEIEELLQAAGFVLTPVADKHLCCGSAGTYSLLQPELAMRLRANKLAALDAGGPSLIATANIGCLTHLQAGSVLPVRHWIELIDEEMF